MNLHKSLKITYQRFINLLDLVCFFRTDLPLDISHLLPNGYCNKSDTPLITSLFSLHFYFGIWLLVCIELVKCRKALFEAILLSYCHCCFYF